MSQSVQKSSPARANVPTGQASQPSPAAFVTLPAGQLKHSVAPSSVAVAQAAHSTLPLEEAYLPTAQSSHDGRPSTSAWLPGEHSMQSDDAEGEYVPALQFVQMVEADWAANWPASHRLHTLPPSDGWAFPASHGLQSVCPTPSWYCPAPQASQAVRPVSVWYVPVGQSSHEVCCSSLWKVPG